MAPPRKIQQKKSPQGSSPRTTISKRGRRSLSFEHEGYTYWGASDPNYFLNLKEGSKGQECWHLTPCTDTNYECVIGRGQGVAEVNGLRMPKGWCVKKEDIGLKTTTK